MSGLLVIISSPSGGGKTSVIRTLMKSRDIDFKYSVSATTRKRRRSEINGKDYILKTKYYFRLRLRLSSLEIWEKRV